MKRIINVVAIGIACMTLVVRGMDHEGVKARQAKRKLERNSKANSLLVNSHSDDIVKLNESVQVRGDKINNLGQKTVALRESTAEYQQAINELKNVPMTKKVATIILFKGGNPAPSSPNNSITIAHTAENNPLITEKQAIIEKEPESNCLVKFFCCGDWCKEER